MLFIRCELEGIEKLERRGILGSRHANRPSQGLRLRDLPAFGRTLERPCGFHVQRIRDLDLIYGHNALSYGHNSCRQRFLVAYGSSTRVRLTSRTRELSPTGEELLASTGELGEAQSSGAPVAHLTAFDVGLVDLTNPEARAW